MAKNIQDLFPVGKYITATPEFPGGKIKNETTPGVSNDGTPNDAFIDNEFEGFRQAAFGRSGITLSGNEETALASDLLKALLVMFQEVKVFSGDWSTIANTTLTIDDKGKFWLHNGVAYTLAEDAQLSTVAPENPESQPNQYVKTEYAPRQEVEGSYLHSNADGVIQGALQLLKANVSELRVSSSDNNGKSRIILDENGSDVATRGLVIERDNLTNITKVYTKTNGDHHVFEISSAGGLTFATLPTCAIAPSQDNDLTNKVYVDDVAQLAADTAEQNAKDASLPVTGGDIKGENPELRMMTDSYNQGKARLVLGQGDGSRGHSYIEYDADTDYFALATAYGSNNFPILESQYSAGTVNFIKEPRYKNKKLATEEYVTQNSIPTGSYVDFPVKQSNSAYLLCDGRIVKRAAYTDLFGVIGDAFNKELDPSDSFRLPAFEHVEGGGDEPELTQEVTNPSFDSPIGAAAYTISNEQYLAVTDASADRVFVYKMTSSNYTLTQTITPPPSTRPHGTAAYTINNEQYLAVTDANVDRVFVYKMTSSNYTLTQTITTPPSTNPNGAAAYTINNDQYLAVTDVNVGRVFVYRMTSSNYTLTQTITNPSFRRPYRAAAYTISNERYLAVADDSADKVFVYRMTSSNYTLTQTITTPPSTNPNGAAAYTINNDQYLAVTDVNVGRVFVYRMTSSNYTLTQTITNPSFSSLSDAAAYTINNDQYLAVADYAADKVFVYRMTSSIGFQLYKYIKA